MPNETERMDNQNVTKSVCNLFQNSPPENKEELLWVQEVARHFKHFNQTGEFPEEVRTGKDEDIRGEMEKLIEEKKESGDVLTSPEDVDKLKDEIEYDTMKEEPDDKSAVSVDASEESSDNVIFSGESSDE